jgi:hypothetical protein
MMRPAPVVAFEPVFVLESIQRFLRTARRPALVEPGEPILLLGRDHFTVEAKPAHILVQAWDSSRNLVRRVTSVGRTEKGKLSLTVQRFAGREGAMQLVDLAHPRTQDWERKGSRMVFRERFRCMLEREFPGWKVAELSTEADLEHSLSPAFPRALLTRGTQAIGAIAAPPDCFECPLMLSFGLIWLDYLRQRNSKHTVGALTFWAPSPVAASLSFYLRWLDSSEARFAMYLYSDEDFAMALDPSNYGNVATALEPCRRPQALPFAIEFAEAVPLANGAVSLRVAGLEFARYHEGRLGNGRESLTLEDARAVAASLHGMRSAKAPRAKPIFQQNPEAWLESIVRSRVELVDASLRPDPVYGQVPAIAGQNRTVLDLLAVEYSGRLAIIELKAAQDIHLPLQALDYWLRVKWHLDRDEFSRFGYFPGIELRREPPRLILVAPSLDFHPSTETVLQYFSPEVEVTRVGLSADWRENARVMFRLQGAERPHE